MPAKATSEKIQPDYFVVMVDFGKIGREAIVNPQDNWTDALDAVREAAAGGERVLFVHHIHDNTVEDRSDEAFRQVMTDLANNAEPLTTNQYEFIELHVSMQAAQSFRRAA
jgi:hypothetical protein